MRLFPVLESLVSSSVPTIDTTFRSHISKSSTRGLVIFTAHAQNNDSQYAASACNNLYLACNGI